MCRDRRGQTIGEKGNPAQEWHRAASRGRRPLSGAPEHQLAPASLGFRVGVPDRASWCPNLYDLGSRANRPGLESFFLMKNLENHIKYDNKKKNPVAQVIMRRQHSVIEEKLPVQFTQSLDSGPFP